MRRWRSHDGPLLYFQEMVTTHLLILHLIWHKMIHFLRDPVTFMLMLARRHAPRRFEIYGLVRQSRSIDRKGAQTVEL